MTGANVATLRPSAVNEPVDDWPNSSGESVGTFLHAITSTVSDVGLTTAEYVNAQSNEVQFDDAMPTADDAYVRLPGVYDAEPSADTTLA